MVNQGIIKLILSFRGSRNVSPTKWALCAIPPLFHLSIFEAPEKITREHSADTVYLSGAIDKFRITGETLLCLYFLIRLPGLGW